MSLWHANGYDVVQLVKGSNDGYSGVKAGLRDGSEVISPNPVPITDSASPPPSVAIPSNSPSAAISPKSSPPPTIVVAGTAASLTTVIVVVGLNQCRWWLMMHSGDVVLLHRQPLLLLSSDMVVRFGREKKIVGLRNRRLGFLVIDEQVWS
ncbi:hypothetical protein L1987_50081 [Smallanthus sonchifolius]|uniref:Uncharacterized protein n=1 Tax=Smallanthus sonchifolius TaxID=185202 RepID=A0ACB9FW87_9ASTR|nr:hypothetical protein L1987_50081 [Smallanthus sonchifolius]